MCFAAPKLPKNRWKIITFTLISKYCQLCSLLIWCHKISMRNNQRISAGFFHAATYVFHVNSQQLHKFQSRCLIFFRKQNWLESRSPPKPTNRLRTFYRACRNRSMHELKDPEKLGKRMPRIRNWLYSNIGSICIINVNKFNEFLTSL